MKKRNKYLIGLLISTPLILFLISGIYFFDLFDYVKKIYHLKNSLVIKNDDIPLFKDTIGYFINIYTIIITGIFSYHIYKSGEKSRQLAIEIKDKEDRKDRQEEIEKVFKVFYTLVYNIEKIIHNDEEGKEDIGNEILLEDNFIKELSVLSTILNKDEIIKVYNIYKNIIVIKNNKKSDKKYRIGYESIMKEVLMEDILNMKILQNVQLEYLLSEQYYDIFNRIYKKQFLDENIESYGNREIIQDENRMHRGIYKDGSFLYEISYKNNNKIKEKILYTDGKVYRDGKYINSKFKGYSKEFLKGRLVYEGYYQNGLYEGTGEKIDSNKIYKGEFLKGQIISGKYQDFLITFNGIFENGRPFSGQGKMLMEDEHNNINYWRDLERDKEDEEKYESGYYDNYENYEESDDYPEDYFINRDNYMKLKKIYGNILYKNGELKIDEENLEVKYEWEVIG